MNKAEAREGVVPMEILIVEDNPGDVFLLRMALENVQYPLHITTLQDGEAALRYPIDEEPSAPHPWPDLILLEVNWPKKSGYEVLAAVRAHPTASSLPALIVSSSSVEKDVRRGYELGAHRYIKKRLNMEDLDEVAAAVQAFCAEFEKRQSKSVERQ